MKTNFIVLCYQDLDDGDIDILHICCYEVNPKKEDIDSLKKELSEDEEFGMTDVKDYKIKIFDYNNPEIASLFKEIGIDIPIEF